MKNFKDLNYRDLFNSFMVFFYNHCIVHFKEYPMFFYFLITALFNTLLIRILSVGNFLYLKPLFADLGMLILFAAFMFLFKTEKKRKKYLVVLSFVTSVVCIVHSMYYTYYDSFASVSLLATSTNIVDVGDALVEQVLNIVDFLYLWQPIFMLFYYLRDNKKVKSMQALAKDKVKVFFDILAL